MLTEITSDILGGRYYVTKENMEAMSSSTCARIETIPCGRIVLNGSSVEFHTTEDEYRMQAMKFFGLLSAHEIPYGFGCEKWGDTDLESLTVVVPEEKLDEAMALLNIAEHG